MHYAGELQYVCNKTFKFEVGLPTQTTADSKDMKRYCIIWNNNNLETERTDNCRLGFATELYSN